MSTHQLASKQYNGTSAHYLLIYQRCVRWRVTYRTQSPRSTVAQQIIQTCMCLWFMGSTTNSFSFMHVLWQVAPTHMVKDGHTFLLPTWQHNFMPMHKYWPRQGASSHNEPSGRSWLTFFCLRVSCARLWYLTNNTDVSDPCKEYLFAFCAGFVCFCLTSLLQMLLPCLHGVSQLL